MSAQSIAATITHDSLIWSVIPWPVWLIFALLVFVLMCHARLSWRDKLYRSIIAHPYWILLVVLAYSVFFSSQLPQLYWETNSRVFFPKDHPAIVYNNEIEKRFGVKEPIIIGIVNNEKGIYNTETLARIKRITDSLFNLPGIVAERKVEISSLATAEYFSGTETQLNTVALMAQVPNSAAQIEVLKQRIQRNADLFVGNIVSADGTAAMIRVKVKEDITLRYQTYFAIRNGILAMEQGDQKNAVQTSSWSAQQQAQWGAKWHKTPLSAERKPNQAMAETAQSTDFALMGEAPIGISQLPSRAGAPWQSSALPEGVLPASVNGDIFYLAGRPVIEVQYGLQAMQDIKLMTPILLLALLLALFSIFRTGLGVLLPIVVMLLGIVWCMGIMAALHVPLYTISGMLPVILLAVGIGGAIHLMGNYYHIVLRKWQQAPAIIVRDLMRELAMPLVATAVTTAAGFLSLTLAPMPPLQIFGLFTALGVMYCWLLSITLIPAVLAITQPKVAGFLEKQRSMRVHAEVDGISRFLVHVGNRVLRRANGVLVVLGGVTVLALSASSQLFVDSSWIGDFRPESEIVKANRLLNARFAGTVFLNVIIDTKEQNGIKNLRILQKMQALQEQVERLPQVGNSLSVVDYIKGMNKAFNADDPAFKVLPATEEVIAEFLYLSSISGRPQLLDEVVGRDYRFANITFALKTDRIRELKTIIDAVKAFITAEFQGLDVEVNTAGMANNSYVWSDLLIRSQINAIVVSKLAVLVLATLLLRSFFAGLLVVLPVVMTTVWIAALAAVLGIPLDVSTTLAAGIAIGVGVDFAIHYIYRTIHAAAQDPNIDQITQASMRRAGRTILLNALVVSAGFMVLFASQFPPNAKTGYFVALYMLLSCTVTLLFLPAVMAKFKTRFTHARVTRRIACR